MNDVTGGFTFVHEDGPMFKAPVRPMNHLSGGCVGHPSTACGRVSLTVPRARTLNQMVTAPSVRGGTMCHAVLSCPV